MDRLEETSLGSHIVSTCETYAAMTSDARDDLAALDELRRSAASGLDRAVVNALSDVLWPARAPFPRRGLDDVVGEPQAVPSPPVDERLDHEILSFAVELASFGPFLADELFLGLDDPPSEDEYSAWLAYATRRHLIVVARREPAAAAEYTVDRPLCEHRLRALAPAA